MCEQQIGALFSQKRTHTKSERKTRLFLLSNNFIAYQLRCFCMCVCTVHVSMNAPRQETKSKLNWQLSSEIKHVQLNLNIYNSIYAQAHACAYCTDRRYYHNNHNIVAIKSMDKCLLYILGTTQTEHREQLFHL